MSKERSTIPEWMTTADAVSLLDAPYRESPSLIDSARAPFAFGLLLVPLLLVIAGIGAIGYAAFEVLTLPTR